MLKTNGAQGTRDLAVDFALLIGNRFATPSVGDVLSSATYPPKQSFFGASPAPYLCFAHIESYVVRIMQSKERRLVRSGRGGRVLSGVRRADARRRMRREARVRRGSRYSGDEALREDSRMKPPKRARTTNGSETENAPQARRRDATNSTRVANAARRVADSRAPALRRGGLRRTRPRRQSNDCRAGRGRARRHTSGRVSTVAARRAACCQAET